jgi:hypothetical protein
MEKNSLCDSVFRIVSQRAAIVEMPGKFSHTGNSGAFLDLLSGNCYNLIHKNVFSGGKHGYREVCI